MILPRCIHPPPEAHQKAEEGEGAALGGGGGGGAASLGGGGGGDAEEAAGQQGRPAGSLRGYPLLVHLNISKMLGLAANSCDQGSGEDRRIITPPYAA